MRPPRKTLIFGLVIALSITLAAVAPFSDAMAEGSRTVVVVVNPTKDGQLAAGYHVRDSHSGQCVMLSEVVVSSVPVFQCTVPLKSRSRLLIACWPITYRSSRSAACLENPWQRDVEIVRAGPIRSSHSGSVGVNLGFPWAVQLASGERCVGTPFGHVSVGLAGDTLDYLCARVMGTGGFSTAGSSVGLVNGASIIKGRLAFVSANLGSDGSWHSGATVIATRAWYGGPVKRWIRP
jgi:hypothetical protein